MPSTKPKGKKGQPKAIVSAPPSTDGWDHQMSTMVIERLNDIADRLARLEGRFDTFDGRVGKIERHLRRAIVWGAAVVLLTLFLWQLGSFIWENLDTLTAGLNKLREFKGDN